MVRFTIITLFPEFFSGILRSGQMGRAIEQEKFACDLVNPRNFARNAYGSIDGKPYGGGAGMVLQIEPLVSALEFIEAEKTAREAITKIPECLQVWVLSPRGRVWSQSQVSTEVMNWTKLAEIGQKRHYVLICGRYEGIDERFIKHYAHREVSVGPYVLNGGEVGAWALVESLARFIPGVVGKAESLECESHETLTGAWQTDWPHYSTPANFRGLEVPEVLQSGHHGKIAQWREAATGVH